MKQASNKSYDYRALAKKMFQLYVMTTKKYLLQHMDNYTTEYEQVNDYLLMKHLQGDKTIGVLLGDSGLTKFLCFDVDVKNNPLKAELITKRLVLLLMYHYRIDKKHIHVSVSGGKGYHVELFFDKATPYKTYEPFYNEVLDKLGETTNRIEMRPTVYGVKLPLGVHVQTDKICWYVNTVSLKPIKNKNYLLSINPMSFEQFQENVLDKVESVAVPKKKPKKVFTLTHEQAEETQAIIDGVDSSNKSMQEIERDIVSVIEANRLFYSGTRHKMTLKIAKYYYWQGQEIEYTKRVIEKIMLNTKHNYEGLIDKNTSIEHIHEDIERTVNDVYEKGYSLHSRTTAVEITKGEILQILEIETNSRNDIHLKRLLFSLLVHSKKFKKKDNSFTMSYSSMTNMGNTDNRSRLLKYLKELEKNDKVKIIQQGVIDEARTKAERSCMHKPNVYAVTLKEDKTEDEKTSISLRTDVKADLYDIIPFLLTEKEAKKMFTKDVYKKHLSKHYKKTS